MITPVKEIFMKEMDFFMLVFKDLNHKVEEDEAILIKMIRFFGNVAVDKSKGSTLAKLDFFKDWAELLGIFI